MSNQKHALIIGGFRECHDVLLNRGYKITWVINKKSLMNTDIKRSVSKMIFYDDSYDLEILVSEIKYLNTVYPIDVLAAFHDEYQLLAYRIANAIGIQPFANLSEKTIKTCLNKDEMRGELEKLSLPKVRYKKINKPSEALKFISDGSIKKAIIKPIAGSGSRSIHLIDEKTNLQEIELFDFSCGLIIEDYIDGDEYSVEVVSVDGKHTLITITKKYTKPGTFIEIGHLVPAPLNKNQYELVQSYMETFLNHIGINNGLSHTEIKIDNQNIYVIETHTRIGGDRIPVLINNSYKLDLYELYCSFISKRVVSDNEDIKLDSPENKCCKFYILLKW